MKKYNNRSEVPEKYKWDLTDFFKNDEEFDKCLKEVKPLIETLTKYKGKIKNPDKMLEYLNKDLECAIKITSLDAYSMLQNDTDLSNNKYINMKNQAINLYSIYMEKSSFFNDELLKISKDEYNTLFIKNEKLLEFKEYLDRIYRQKDHILKESEEIISSNLINAANSYSDISSNLINNENNYGTITIDNEEITIATNNISKLLRNKDRNIRIEVYNKFYSKLKEYSKTLAALLNSYCKLNDEDAKNHKFKNAWDRKIFNWNLDNKVFETLVTSTEKNLDKLHKYYKLVKERLNLENLYPYDLNVPLNKEDTTYTIEEAQQICLESTKILGEDYTKHFKKVFDDHHIDYCQYKGKTSGGYMVSTYIESPKILLSFNNNFNSISTIIHEGGHDVNHQYINENNSPIYRHTPTLLSEVMSLTNECLLSHYMVKEGKNKEEKLMGLENIMRVIVSNLYGAVREGKIEQDMYNHIEKGNALTEEYLNKLTHESFEKYYGKEVVLDENQDLTWITRSHYYMNYYLYSYAICITIACNIAQKIISNDKDMLEKYEKLLKVGGDVWVKDAFKELGIDLEDKTIYENAFKYFDSLIEEYKSLL